MSFKYEIFLDPKISRLYIKVFKAQFKNIQNFLEIFTKIRHHILEVQILVWKKLQTCQHLTSHQEQLTPKRVSLFQVYLSRIFVMATTSMLLLLVKQLGTVKTSNGSKYPVTLNLGLTIMSDYQSGNWLSSYYIRNPLCQGYNRVYPHQSSCGGLQSCSGPSSGKGFCV